MRHRSDQSFGCRESTIWIRFEMSSYGRIRPSCASWYLGKVLVSHFQSKAVSSLIKRVF